MLKSELKYAGKGEEGSLMVFSPPGEFVPDGSPSSCMAIPILPREGGLLIAIPTNYLAPHVLLDAATGEEGSLLGPSKDIVSQFLEEDESGVEQNLDSPGTFLALDVADSAVSMFREYDAIIDPSSVIQPFLDLNSTAVPDIAAALDSITTWIETLSGDARGGFYSAREEQEPAVPKAAKKAAAKRVTTAALAQTVEALSVQMTMLLSQQEALMKKANPAEPHGAIPAAEPPIGAASAIGLPPVSQGFSKSPAMGVAKAAQLVGPPPRTSLRDMPSMWCRPPTQESPWKQCSW